LTREFELNDLDQETNYIAILRNISMYFSEYMLDI
jgi:hypothetical protein